VPAREVSWRHGYCEEARGRPQLAIPYDGIGSGFEVKSPWIDRVMCEECHNLEPCFLWVRFDGVSLAPKRYGDTPVKNEH